MSKEVKLFSKDHPGLRITDVTTIKKNTLHPSHYNTSGRKECWDEMIDVFGEDAVVIFDILNAYKYYYRAGNKDGNPKEQDIEKIHQYMQHAMKLLHHSGLMTISMFMKMDDILVREGLKNAN